MQFEYVNDTYHASVIVEDNGRVAYAYLVIRDDIVGDVWLYNSGPTPMTPEWRDREKMPFANSRDYVQADEFKPVVDSAEVEVLWNESRSRKDLEDVTVRIRGTTHAVLTRGSKPGWCRLAAKDGPLAKVLHDSHLTD